MSRLPIVAVVGRPNVGKSTLVNRIVGGRPAVTEERPGVTRDRREFLADWTGREFLLVDTGGWELTPGEPLSSAIRAQAEAAMHSADAVIFVVDATSGLTDDDDGVV
ncbi:MAG: GTPase, partial [Acidimicrobiia bacterium]